MAFFSIVIPVYNGTEHMRECLDSLLEQPFEDIEVICVDDASTDASPALLNSYAAKDSRVRVITNEENRGSARSRRRGALASEGRYVLFSDQDDSYAPAAFETLYTELVRDPVDVLQYDTLLFNDGGVSKGEITGLAKWLEPFCGSLNGREILDACFVDSTFAYSIWNKAYDGDMARKSFSATEDVPIPLGEDNYASFVLLYFANSYRGLPGKKFYCYHFGRGYTGRGSQSVESFRRTCGLVVAANLIERFLQSVGAFDEYGDTCRAARTFMLDYLIGRWTTEVADEDKLPALQEVIDQWPYREVLEAMARLQPEQLPQLLEARFGRRPFVDGAGNLPPQAFDDLNKISDRLGSAIEAFQGSCRRVEALTESYEESSAYRVGRAITAPIRRIRGE